MKLFNISSDKYNFILEERAKDKDGNYTDKFNAIGYYRSLDKLFEAMVRHKVDEDMLRKVECCVIFMNDCKKQINDYISQRAGKPLKESNRKAN